MAELIRNGLSPDLWLTAEMAELRKCETDPTYFITTYCYAENLHDEDTSPVPAVEVIPCWPHVEGMLEALFPPKDVVIEKSRRMMASWVMMAAVLHDLLFKQNWPVMVVSRVETDVDNGGDRSTSRSLFGKVRFMWNHLPPFLQKKLVFRYLSIKNPGSGAYAEGYSSTISAGRGGGYRRAILDEFAWMEHSEQVMASVGQACSWGKVLTSTPHGRGNAFYRIKKEAFSAFPVREEPKSDGQFARYTIHWKLHPHRDDKWKERLVASNAMTDEAIAQELEIDYLGSRGQRVYPKYVEDQQMSGGSLCPVKVSYRPDRPLIVCCDFNHDPLIWEVAQTHSTLPTYRVVDELCLRNAVVEDACYELVWRYGSRVAVEQMQTDHPDWKPQCPALREQAGIGGHESPVWVYGDSTEEKSTVHNRVKTYQQIKSTLRKYGLHVSLRVPKQNPPIARRIEVHNHALANGFLVIHPSCEELRKDYESGIWDRAQHDMDQHTIDDDGSGLTRSHASSALGYWLYCVHRAGASDTAASRSFPRAARTYLPKAVTGW